MALINCPECGKKVSGQAQSCPNCGTPILNRLQNNGWYRMRKGLGLFNVIIGLCVFMMESTGNNNLTNCLAWSLILSGLFSFFGSKSISLIITAIALHAFCTLFSLFTFGTIPMSSTIFVYEIVIIIFMSISLSKKDSFE